jgi:hypothetical protein
MNFAEHLERHRNDDGSHDLDAAEAARAKELADSPESTAQLALKAAKHERAAWEKTETANLRKMFSQPALSPELELEIKVPLGDSTAVAYGDMNHIRIRLRKDMRTRIHLREIRAFDVELTHWLDTEALLPDGQTIREAMGL